MLSSRKLILVLPLALLGAGSGCRRSEALAPPAPVPAAAEALRVEVQPAQRRKFQGALPVTGELRPAREVTLKSRVGGNVVELRYDEGDTVKKGQVIARIEAVNQRAQYRSSQASVSLAEAQLERARADLEKSERDRARIEMLYQKGAADKRSLDDTRTGTRLGQVSVQTAEAQLRQALAGKDAASNGVAETLYRAPFDGVISRRGVSLYEYIDTFKNRDIVSIVDNSSMELVAAVPADLSVDIEKGAKVEFRVGALQRQLSGEIIAISPSADPKTRSIRLRVRIPNPDGVLKGGMYATGVVRLGGERAGVGVPAEAVHFEEGRAAGEDPEGGQRVLWRVRDRKVEKLVVRTGSQDGDLVEILGGGVADGDQIVVSSPSSLQPGLLVLAKVPDRS